MPTKPIKPTNTINDVAARCEGRLLTDDDLREIGISGSRATTMRLERTQGFPRGIVLSARMKRRDGNEVAAWLRSRLRDDGSPEARARNAAIAEKLARGRRRKASQRADAE